MRQGKYGEHKDLGRLSPISIERRCHRAHDCSLGFYSVGAESNKRNQKKITSERIWVTKLEKLEIARQHSKHETRARLQ